MSLNVKKHMPVLDFLKIAPSKVRKLILETADDDFVLAICEICLNFCKGNLKCKNICFDKLKKHKNQIHALARVQKRKKENNINKNKKKKKKNTLNNNYLKSERRVLCQNGGGVAFLPLLLAPALSALTEFFLNKTVDRN